MRDGDSMQAFRRRELRQLRELFQRRGADEGSAHEWERFASEEELNVCEVGFVCDRGAMRDTLPQESVSVRLASDKKRTCVGDAKPDRSMDGDRGGCGGLNEAKNDLIF